MKCQMQGCQNKATVWSLYDDEPGYAMCQECADRCKAVAAHPDKFETRVLTKKVAKLLQELNRDIEWTPSFNSWRNWPSMA